MSTAARKHEVTPAEYLAVERLADKKHEYDRGRIIAMSGASRWHNLIVGNLYSAIHGQLKGRSCEAYANDMRVEFDDLAQYAYPDITIVCGAPEFRDQTFDTLVNPTVLIEVLSPSTEARDRGRKFAGYRRLDSLQEYVLVSQDRPCVERFSRQGDLWVLTEWVELDDALRLDSVGVSVPLREIFAKVRFTPDESPAND